MGRRFTVWEYAALLHVPILLTIVLAHAEQRAGLLAPLVLLPWATTLVQRVRREPSGPGLNAVLASTARFGLVYALLLSAGALIQV